MEKLFQLYESVCATTGERNDPSVIEVSCQLFILWKAVIRFPGGRLRMNGKKLVDRNAGEIKRWDLGI